MRLQWLGHACFRVQADGYAIVIDPYGDGHVPGLLPLRLAADAVYCSHGHGDHGYVEAVTLEMDDKPSPFTVTTVDSFHDDAGGALRGANTIHVLAASGVRVAHLGDLGAALDDAQIQAIGPVDAIMVPVGGHFTIDAQAAKAVVDALSPRVVIPMHYRSDAFGFDVIGTLDPFLALMTNVRHYDGNTIDITADTPAQTAVLSYIK